MIAGTRLLSADPAWRRGGLRGAGPAAAPHPARRELAPARQGRDAAQRKVAAGRRDRVSNHGRQTAWMLLTVNLGTLVAASPSWRGRLRAQRPGADARARRAGRRSHATRPVGAEVAEASHSDAAGRRRAARTAATPRSRSNRVVAGSLRRRVAGRCEVIPTAARPVARVTLGEPLIKVAAFSFGVRRALTEENRALIAYRVRRERKMRRRGMRRAEHPGGRREPGLLVRRGRRKRRLRGCEVPQSRTAPDPAGSGRPDRRRRSRDCACSPTRCAREWPTRKPNCASSSVSADPGNPRPALARERRRSRCRQERSERQMDTAEIRRRFLAHFEEPTTPWCPSASLLARRPDPAVRQRRHGAVHAVLPRPGDAARTRAP